MTATLDAEGDDAKLYLMKGKNTDSGLIAAPAQFEGNNPSPLPALIYIQLVDSLIISHFSIFVPVIGRISFLISFDLFFFISLHFSLFLFLLFFYFFILLGISELREAGKINEDILFNVVSTARVTKSDSEIIAMWYSSYVASNAHVEVMRSVQPGMVEYELEARFLYEIYKNGGCRKCAYTSICACGPNNAILHYGHAGAPNDRTLQSTDMCLLDMGADYHGYVSDITCSFPVARTFSTDQKAIYEGVLNAQKAVLEIMMPGTSWVACHRVAEKEILSALQNIGIIHSQYSIDELSNAGVGDIFFPHGLGHLIGLDTHDVGGYLDGTPERPQGPGGVKKLRTARVLEDGMVLTNEPGCYFIDALISSALLSEKKKYFDENVLMRFQGFGGVRLEDVVVVTKKGPINLTTCPRTVKEIEDVMSGGMWPPLSDEAPYLFRRWGKLAPGGVGMLDVKLGSS